MANTAKAALPYPALSAVPNVPSDMQALANATDPLVIPKYATTTARNTANPTPTAGDLCYVTNVSLYYYYSADATAWVGFSPVTTIYKTADESRSSTTTLTNDGGANPLIWNVQANSQYHFEGTVYFQTTANPGFKTHWAQPGGCVYRIEHMYNTTVPAFFWGYDTSGTYDHYCDNTVRTYGFRGTITTAGTAGSFGLQWCQTTSNATATTVFAVSFVKYMKFA